MYNSFEKINTQFFKISRIVLMNFINLNIDKPIISKNYINPNFQTKLLNEKILVGKNKFGRYNESTLFSY